MSVFAGIFPASSFALHYASIRVCAQTYIHIHMRVCTHTHTHTHTHICMQTCTHTHTHTHMNAYLHTSNIACGLCQTEQITAFSLCSSEVMNVSSTMNLTFTCNMANLASSYSSCLQQTWHYIHCVSLPSWYMLYIICNLAVGEMHIIRHHSGSLKKTDDAF